MRAVATGVVVTVAALGACSGGASSGASAPADAGGVDASAPDASLDASSCLLGCQPPPPPPGACTDAQKAAALARMAQAPVIPPGRIAGIDLRGPLGKGLTIDDAQVTLCQGDAQGDLFGDGTQVMSWGYNADFWVIYDPQTRLISSATFYSPDLAGVLSFHSADGQHQYRLQMGKTATKDGSPFLSGWDQQATREAQVDELYQALMATFDPAGVPDASGASCVVSGACTAKVLASGIYGVGVPALGLGINEGWSPPPDGGAQAARDQIQGMGLSAKTTP